MSGEPPVLDLWLPVTPRGKGRPLMRTIPRSKDVDFMEREIPDPSSDDGFKIAKYYQLTDVRPSAYGETTTKYEAAVRREIERQYRAQTEFRTIRGAVTVDWCAYFQPVKSNPKRVQRAKIAGEIMHVSRPDKDNIEKLIFDAMDTLAYLEDCQINFGTGAKMFSHREGIRILVKQSSAQAIKDWEAETFHWEEEDFTLSG